MSLHNIIHFSKVSSVQDRINKTMEIILKLNPSTILDIGGKDYMQFCLNHNITYTCIDLQTPQKTGEGGYNKDKKGLTYDGRNLPFNSNEFDLIIVILLVANCQMMWKSLRNRRICGIIESK